MKIYCRNPKLIFINVKRYFIRFYLWIFVFIYYKLSHGISVFVAPYAQAAFLLASSLHRVCVVICGEFTRAHAHTRGKPCRKYSIYRWWFAFSLSLSHSRSFSMSLHLSFEIEHCCMFIWTAFGVAVNYAMTSIFVGLKHMKWKITAPVVIK